jgi:hypothetical protein
VLQSAGHAPEFEKLPKFQRLGIRWASRLQAVGRHDLLVSRQQLPSGHNDATGRGNPYNKDAVLE